jgi:hypothetical protein
MNNGPDNREALIGKAWRGEISSDVAEAEAKRLGIGPLARKPKESSFDPMSEPWWTLPMAIAWIGWRRPRQVLRCWDEYRLKCLVWRRVLGRDRLVWDSPVTLSRLLLAERGAESAVKNRKAKIVKSVMSVQSAKAELWKALQEGTLHATGVNFDTGRRITIRDFEWCDLECIEEQGRDIICARDASPRTSVRMFRRREGVANGYIEVVVRRTDITANWRSSEPTLTGAGRLKATEPAPKNVARRGAAPKYDWGEAEMLVFELMDKNGEFREWDVESGWCTRADLERRVLEYFDHQVTRNKLKRSPGESTVREKVRLFLAKWRSAQEASKGR